MGASKEKDRIEKIARELDMDDISVNEAKEIFLKSDVKTFFSSGKKSVKVLRDPKNPKFIQSIIMCEDAPPLT